MRQCPELLPPKYKGQFEGSPLILKVEIPTFGVCAEQDD